MLRFCLGLLLLLAMVGCSSEEQDNDDDFPTPTPPSPITETDGLLELHNKARATNYPLVVNDKLTKAAQKHAQWMAFHEEMSHTGLDGSSFYDRIKDEAYYPKTGGENIAVGQDSAEEVFYDWMRSWGHKRNILSKKYTEVGFGYAVDGKGRKYWCTVFAAPSNNDSAVGSIFDEESFPEGIRKEQ